MVLFSVVHARPVLLAVGLAGVAGSMLWIFALLISPQQGRPYWGWRDRILIGLLLATLGVFFVPYDSWQTLMVWVRGPGPYAQEQLAAAETSYLTSSLLAHGVDVNAANDDGRTALVSAVATGNLDKTASLLTRGADPNVSSPDGTALHFAARNGQTQIVRLLLEAGADPNLADGDGSTAGGIALMYHHDEIARLIAERRER